MIKRFSVMNCLEINNASSNFKYKEHNNYTNLLLKMDNPFKQLVTL